MASNTPRTAALLAAARQAMAQRKIDEATLILQRVLARDPGCEKAHRLAGVASLMGGDAQTAATHLRRALALRPDDPDTLMSLGSALFELGRVEQALTHLRHACDLAPQAASAWYNLGRAQKIAGQGEDARAALDRALGLDPAHLKARMELASTLKSLGATAESAAQYREVLRRQPRYAKAWFQLSDIKTLPLSADDTARIRGELARPGLGAEARVWLGFALARALDVQRDYAAAFAAWQDANALKRKGVTWDIDAEHARIDGLMRAFGQPIAPPLDPKLGEEVIFIACVPRSGSTLTEQILASHSAVEGANEIEDLRLVLAAESDRRHQALTQWAGAATSEDWARLGREYLARTARWRQHKPRCTDKNLGNWALIGAALAMLPGAHVVNSRRDPLETCFACYRQLFSRGVPFSYDLEAMAHYYAGYERLSRFWKDRFPERWYDHVYEALQADPEAQIRHLLAFCGLPFERSCLDFHHTQRLVMSARSAGQVRQPLRRDTARASDYESQLGPLRKLLNDLDVPTGTAEVGMG